ncbi:MAG: hypothetical protein ABL308_02795 [Oceanicaulis sp.]
MNDAAVTEVPAGLSGDLLLNTRVISRTGAFFDSVVESRTADAVSASDLVGLFVLLEAIATSNALNIDGTVPAHETDAVEAAFARFRSRAGAAGDVLSARPLTPADPERVLALCGGGIAQSSAVLTDSLDAFARDRADFLARNPGLRPLKPEAAAKFADALADVFEDPEARAVAALKLVRTNPFNGAKCAAGLLVADIGVQDLETASALGALRRSATAVLRDAGPDQGLVAAILINGFRSNYLNTLAAEEGRAALFAAPEIETVREQQTLLLSRYCADRLVAGRLGPAIDETVFFEAFRRQGVFPFFGLLTFLAADETDPYALFAETVAERETLLAQFLAKKSPQARFIHDLDPDAFEAFREDRLDRTFQRLNRRVAIHDAVQQVSTRFQLPALVSLTATLAPLINMVLGGADAGFEIPESADIGEEVTPYALRRALLGGGLCPYATFTHSIDRKLTAVLADRETGALIANKVERVFKRPLAA